MRKLFIITIIWITACNQDEVGLHSANFNESFSLSVQDPVRMPDLSNSTNQVLTITLMSALESRCPGTPENNISCIWAGNAIITVSVANMEETKEVEACLGDCSITGSGNEIEFEIGNSGYKLIFVALTPHPSETVNMEEKPEQSATLKLIKL